MDVPFAHTPVMADEVVRALLPKPGDVVCDCTLGGAGHTLELAKRIQPDGLSIGIDQDDAALSAARMRFEREMPGSSHLFLKGNFADLDELLTQAAIAGVDAFIFDLGVSSPQLDVAERGFSYNADAPLDMRMDQKNTLTAADVVNTYAEGDLVRILRTYGDEKFAARIARAIVSARAKATIATTGELAELVKGAIPAAARRGGHNPARKTFQAIRIEVNHELDALNQGLEAAIRWANPGARIGVISYHSLEDRIVKHVFAQMSEGCICPPDLPVCVCGHVPIVKVVTKKPLTSKEEEKHVNPRSRSALLRVAEKLDTTGTTPS